MGVPFYAALTAYNPSYGTTTNIDALKTWGTGGWSTEVPGPWTSLGSGRYSAAMPVASTSFCGWDAGTLSLGSGVTVTSGQYFVSGSTLYVNLDGSTNPSTKTILVDGDNPWLDMVTLAAGWTHLEPSFITSSTAGFDTTTTAWTTLFRSLVDAWQRSKGICLRVHMNDTLAPTFLFSSQSATNPTETIAAVNRLTLAGGESLYAYRATMWHEPAARRHRQRFLDRIQLVFQTVVPAAYGGDTTTKWVDLVEVFHPGLAAHRQGAEMITKDFPAAGLAISAISVSGGKFRYTTGTSNHGLVTGDTATVFGATQGGFSVTPNRTSTLVTRISNTVFEFQTPTGVTGSGGSGGRMILGTYTTASPNYDQQYNVDKWRSYYSIGSAGSAADATLNLQRRYDQKQAWLDGLNDCIATVDTVYVTFAAGELWEDLLVSAGEVIPVLRDPDFRVVGMVTNFNLGNNATAGTFYKDKVGAQYKTYAATSPNIVNNWLLPIVNTGRRLWVQTFGNTGYTPSPGTIYTSPRTNIEGWRLDVYDLMQYQPVWLETDNKMLTPQSPVTQLTSAFRYMMAGCLKRTFAPAATTDPVRKISTMNTANPIQLTVAKAYAAQSSANHGLAVGDEVWVFDASGTAVPDGSYVVQTVPSATTLTLTGFNGGSTVYTADSGFLYLGKQLAQVQPDWTAEPTITGTGEQGQTLTAHAATWNVTITTHEYKWQKSSDGGSTWSDLTAYVVGGTTYVLQAADVNTVVRVLEKATTADSLWTVSPSQQTATINLPAAPVNSVLPAITGTTASGQTLTTDNGTWSGSPTYARQWYRVSTEVPFGTPVAIGTGALTYQLTVNEVDKLVYVVVTATNAGGSIIAESAKVGPVTGTAAPVNTVAPVISGTLTEGSILSTTDGSWTGTPTSFTYQWYRNGVAIGAATNNTYTLAAADLGTDVHCVVTGVNASGSNTSTSNTLFIGASSSPHARALWLKRRNKSAVK